MGGHAMAETSGGDAERGEGARKRLRIAVEPGPIRAEVQSISEGGEPELVAVKTREESFDAWLAKQPVPWSAEDAHKKPAAEAAEAGTAEPVGASALDEEARDGEAERFEDHRKAQAHLLSAYEEMKKLKWALQLFKEKKMDVALLDNKQDTKPATDEELLAEAKQRVREKQQHLRGAASRLRERAAALRTSVKQGRAYHHELAKLNRAWRVRSAAAVKEENKAAMQHRDMAPGQTHVVDCFMPNCIGAGPGGESYVSLRKRENGGVGVLSQTSCCHISVTDVKTSAEEELEPSAGCDAGTASCHQLLRHSQRGRQNQLLADLLVREANGMAAPDAQGGSKAAHRIAVVVDASMLHLQYLPGRALRFRLHVDPMPKPAAAQVAPNSDENEAEGGGSGRASTGRDETPMGLLMRSLVLSTAGVSASASKADVLAQLVAAARFRASRDTAFALLDALVEEYYCRPWEHGQPRRPTVVHWLPSSGSGTVIELSMPRRGKVRLVLPATGSGLVKVSTFGTKQPRSAEVRMAQLAEFLRVELSRNTAMQSS